MKKSTTNVMAFYHQNGIIPSWKHAGTFAGTSGHIATLPDIITARLATKPGEVPWENYFTTTSSEYMWKSKGGTSIIIVAHGDSPMATLKGVCSAYRHSFKDKTRKIEGGRISEKEFYDLESGKYGEVSIVDLSELANKYLYLFCNTTIRASEALSDPLMKARLGKRAEDYIRYHAKLAKEWHLERNLNIEDPFILTMGGAPSPNYGRSENDGKGFKSNFERIGIPFAHLLSISGLAHLHHEGQRSPSLVSDVDCHGWTDGTRFIGVRSSDMIKNIHIGPDTHRLLREKWPSLMKSTFQPKTFPLYVLMKFGKNTWFTQKRKVGACMDNGEPEFHVKSLQKSGQPIDFITSIGGYHGFFKYDIKEVEKINTYNCNAYSVVGDVQTLWNGGNPEYHKTKVQFYRAEIDTTKCLMKEEELCNDYDKLMLLIAK